MAKIDTLPGILPAETAALRAQAIYTDSDLWQAVGADYNQGIKTLADKAKIKPERLLELLKAQALRQGQSHSVAWPARNWLELVLLALLLLVAGLFGYARSTGVMKWLAAPLGWGQPGQANQVYAVQALPAYHRIVAQDLAEGVRPAQSGAMTDPAEALGRFTLQKVASGSPLLADSLSVPANPQSGEYVVISLPVTGQALALVSPGQPVSFILAPRQPGQDCHAAAPLEGIILAAPVGQDSAAIVVAMPSGQLPALRACLGFSDVVIAR